MFVSVCSFVETSGDDLSQKPLVDVQAKLLATDGLELTFEFENQGDLALRMNEFDLPWKGTPDLKLFLLRMAAREPLIRPSLPIIDPTVGKVVLQPHSRLSGKINLIERYPNIAQELENEDLVLCWAYQFSYTADRRVCFSGAVTLPKSTIPK